MWQTLRESLTQLEQGIACRRDVESSISHSQLTAPPLCDLCDSHCHSGSKKSRDYGDKTTQCHTPIEVVTKLFAICSFKLRDLGE